MKKRFAIVWLLALSIVLSGCPPKRPDKSEVMKMLKANRYNFRDFRNMYFQGIYFRLPKEFEENYNTSFLYKTNGLTRSIYELGVTFSVEKFEQPDLDQLLFEYEDEEVDPAEIIHDFYIRERIKSLREAGVSIKTGLPAGSRASGFVQVVLGNKYSYEPQLNYLIATVEKNGSWYVFQCITNPDMSAYLLDDFQKIVKSAH